MGFLSKLHRKKQLNNESKVEQNHTLKCDFKCKLCVIQNCCGNCAFGKLSGGVEGIGVFCDFQPKLHGKPSFVELRNKPILHNCGRWRSAYNPKHV
jgi:hypothetical protein